MVVLWTQKRCPLQRKCRNVKWKFVLLWLFCACFVVGVLWKVSCFSCRPNILQTKQEALVPPFVAAPGEQKHDVLVSAYMNSGSRFTGRLLGYLPDSFYFYEPLWKFALWDYFRPPNKQCSTISGDCRQIKTADINFYTPLGTQELEPIIKNISSFHFSSVQPAELMVNVLSRVFACDLGTLHGAIQDRVQDHPNYVGPSWQEYRSCIVSFHAKSECLKKLETLCKSRTHRVLKVLRLTVGSFRPLLELNPRLKIVHLVRDPRAIVHSRRYSRYYPETQMERDKRAMESSLCEKMLQDIIDCVELMQAFPNRIAVLYYEDLMDDLHTRLKHLYSFLHIEYDKNVVTSLAEVLTNLPPPEKGIDFLKDRERNNTKWWRKYMEWEDVLKVDRECSVVYNKLGYKRLYNEKHLRDFTFSTYSIPDMFKLPGVS